MMKKHLLLLIVSLFIMSTYAQTNPKKEVRAVWLTTIWNIDWPTSTGEVAQKAELIQKLDELKAANFNTIYIQVRSRGDLIYPSAIEPWARSMTGTHGQNPGWDPLEFVIQACHERGLEAHAWFVTFNVHSGSSSIASTTPNHPKNSHPSWVVQHIENGTTLWWLNPGLPQVRDYLTSILVEMISAYDLDGVQFDYIRYPGQGFNDATTYSTYGNGVNIDDWRRENINQFVRQAYDTIQAIKPHIKLGSAPIGIYKNIPNGTGWEGFYEIYQDSRRWLLEGNHDYLCPQVYWDMGSNPQFNVVSENWVQNNSGRHIYTGIASYRMEASEQDWTTTELRNQINATRSNGANGQSYFSASQFTDNLKSVRSVLAQNEYEYPANIPNMPWKDSVSPNEPLNFNVTQVNTTTYDFSWGSPQFSIDGDTIKYYNVYASETSPVDITDVKNMIGFYIRDTFVDNLSFTSVTGDAYFVVTAYDDAYNESDVSIEKDKNNISALDAIAPTLSTQVQSVWQIGDFAASFVESDDSLGVGLNSCFYQVSFKDPINYYWTANSEKSFYRDEFESGLLSGVQISGDFSSGLGMLSQREETNANTDLRIGFDQLSNIKYLYHWRARISGAGNNKRAGIHFMISDQLQTSNRGDSYFVYFRTDDNKIQIFKVINNVFALEQETQFVLNDNQWYDKKILYDKSSGEIIIYVNDEKAASWIDSNPLTTGSEISVRTGESKYDIDYLNVYHDRQMNTSLMVTVGSDVLDDISTLNENENDYVAQIKSICIDNSSNISNIDSVNLFVDTTSPVVDFVYDGDAFDVDTSFYTNVYQAKWLGYDNNSGILEHQIAIGASPSSADILNWINYGQNLTFSDYGLNLVPNQTYYFTVRTINNAGLDKILSSDGLFIHPNATIGVDEINQAISQVIVYPNPFMDKVTLDFKDGFRGKVKINLIDSRGRKVFSKKVKSSKSSSQVQLDFPQELNKGNYILQIQSEDRQLDKFVYLVK